MIEDAVAELKSKKYSLKDIHSVERIGGGTRIPRVEEIIKETF